MKNRLISKVLMGVGIAAALVAFYAIEPVFHPSAHAENGRIVTIYHDGQQQVIATEATTVGEALDRAGVKLEQNDAVEPAANTKLVAQNYDVNVYRARPVIVVDGAQRYRIISPYQSAKKIAESAGLQVYDEDQLTISRIDDFVAQGGAGLMLTVKRSTPVHLMLYGKLVDVRTQASTIGELMKEKGVNLAAQDGVSPATGAAISAGMTVDVYRNGEQTASVEQDVDFTVKQIQDADQPLGYKQVQTPGVKGKRIVTYQIVLKNGKEVGRKEIQSIVTTEPKEQVEVIGTKPAMSASQNKTVIMQAVGIAESDYAYVDYILTRESGWCATKLQGHPGACPSTPPSSIPTGLGYGLCQSTPGIKMATAGADWQFNPITQMKWCNSYALSRYGSWRAAYNHWLASHNW